MLSFAPIEKSQHWAHSLSSLRFFVAQVLVEPSPSCYGRLNNVPQRHPGPNPWNIRILSYMAKIDFADVVKGHYLNGD